MRSPRRSVVRATSTLAVLATAGLLAGGLTLPTAGAAPTPSPGATGSASPKPTPKNDDRSWSAVPAQRPNSKALRTTFFVDGQPGSTVIDALQIGNDTNARLPLTIYASDAGNITDGGAYTVRPITEKMTAVGSWVTPAQRTVAVPKGKGLRIPFKVTIPRSAPPGEHVGGIVALGAAPKEADDGSKVVIQRAIAVRLIVRVAGLNTNVVVVDKVELDAKAARLPFVGDQGRATVTFTYRNVGTVTVRPKATVKLTGLFGRTLHQSQSVQLPDTFPGQTVRITEQFDGMPVLDRVTARVEITDPGQEQRSIAAASAAGETTALVVSWVFLLLLVLIVAAVVGWRFWRRRGAGGPDAYQPAHSGAPEPAPAGATGGAPSDAPRWSPTDGLPPGSGGA